MGAVKPFWSRAMPIEVWQIAEVKKALRVFCNDHDLKPDDELVLQAADDLLKIAQEGADSSELMLRKLKNLAAENPVADKYVSAGRLSA
jgi:hypothetical protein